MRYFVRYAGKAQGFEELYEVVDSTTGETLSARQPHERAKQEAAARNAGTEFMGMHGWLGGLNFNG